MVCEFIFSHSALKRQRVSGAPTRMVQRHEPLRFRNVPVDAGPENSPMRFRVRYGSGRTVDLRGRGKVGAGTLHRGQ